MQSRLATASAMPGEGGDARGPTEHAALDHASRERAGAACASWRSAGAHGPRRLAAQAQELLLDDLKPLAQPGRFAPERFVVERGGLLVVHHAGEVVPGERLVHAEHEER